ncbi:RHS repeat-associated core domain-containing protein [Pseudomonas sp. NFIX10]|uniref:RHS repeat-associated core domain-containing protein n=1 Tax=unclassified Pseudomonas TaxID=196821 RepID=UPI0008838A53|nr:MULTISPECIES: RHS repeat-associated core domain-containing protein [unclassified Pseudomonas]SCZ10444.1 RHS repeat-associated core domain-containing protein [Pseudomonas sp. NFACC37-1]SFB39544.1 RHS repeat-associated core domain-containing protein [Pseudomonas sp. NFIX10]SFF13527.1 RHS repeat-associated core domain-containing protein [Pseudomonas sp. NFACC06-1]SFO97552.1 RHS repeat-associated core domain-containing protein [Pseudomonas sp. NFACC24-1]
MPIENKPQAILFATDQNQSILAQVSSIDIKQVAYCAYGYRPMNEPPSTHLGFNGELREYEPGWYILGNGYRAYNPVLRRFHSPDRSSPFDRGGLNPYAYCVGDPINYRDPTGHLAIFSLGGALLGRLATPTGALTATSIISGIAALAVMKKDPAVGTALLVISAASGLGAGYVSFGGRSSTHLTDSRKKIAFNSDTMSFVHPEKASPYGSLFKSHPEVSAPITAHSPPTALPRKTQNKLTGTAPKERKDYWPGATRERERIRALQQEQEIRALEAEHARITTLENARIRRHTGRPILRRQNGNMRT